MVQECFRLYCFYWFNLNIAYCICTCFLSVLNSRTALIPTVVVQVKYPDWQGNLDQGTILLVMRESIMKEPPIGKECIIKKMSILGIKGLLK